MIAKVNIPEGTCGRWKVEKFVVDPESLSYKLAALRDRGRLPSPGTYTRLVRGNDVIMSDTPAEMADHRHFVQIATGSILINGLGLGMVLAAVLAKDCVTDVTVVEQSEDVYNLVAEHYLSDSRVTVILADAYKWQPPKGKRYNAVWHDIWDDICSDNLEGMGKLHRKYGKRTDWQDSWARDICLYQKRQDARRRSSYW